MTLPLMRIFVLPIAILCSMSPVVAKDKKLADPNRKVCRTDVPTGSMMRKSVCHTAADWAQIDAVQAASAESMRDRTNRTGSQQ